MASQRVQQHVIQDLIDQIGVANLGLLLEKVQREVPVLWRQLADATRANDSKTVFTCVHNLSSIFKSVGLTAIGEQLSGIESQLRSGVDMDPAWLEELEQEKCDSLRALELLVK